MERTEQECHRILVVDDDQPILDFLRSLLQPLSTMAPLLSADGKTDAGGAGLPYDFEVVTLLQGEDAVAEVARSEAQQRPFSVALIDMHMPPGINGLETARQLLQISPQIEIVFLTAYTEYSLGEIHAVLGANFSFMSKPCQRDDLVQRVVDSSAKWESRKRLHEAHAELLRLTAEMQREIELRKEAEQREQFIAFQSGVAEMSTNILHNVGNTIQGMDSAVINLSQRLQELEKIQGLYRQLAERFRRMAPVSDVRAAQQLTEDMVQVSSRLPDVLQELKGRCERPMQILQTGVSHIKRVVQAQQQSSKPDLEEKKVVLAQLLEDLRLLTADVVGRGGVELQCEIRGGRGVVTLPQNQLLQALLNLVINAVESIEEAASAGRGEERAGRIVLSVEVEEQTLSVVVEDNGVGFDPALSEELFRFGFTTKPDGNGFGLHATGNFVASLGGEISLQSAGSGQGARVTMVLPLHHRYLPVEC